MLDTFLQYIRHAARLLCKNPGFKSPGEPSTSCPPQSKLENQVRLHDSSKYSSGTGSALYDLFPGQMASADASGTTLQKVLGTAVIAGIYFAIPLISLKSISSLLANAFCILFPPYVAILFLFSGWSAPSAKASHWLLYVLVGNVALFVASLVGAILSFSKRGSAR